MGAFLDKFEGLILNYSRRIISAGILLVLIGMAWNFLAGALNSIDSPNVDSGDTYDLPGFEEPEVKEDPIEPEQKNNDSSPQEKKVVDRIEREYSDELDNMAENMAPVFVSFYSYETIDSAIDSLRPYFAKTVKSLVYDSSMNRDQRDEWVDAADDYLDDLSGYMIDKYEINRRNPVTGDQTNLKYEDESFMKQPLREFSTGANLARSNHMDEVEAAKYTAAGNNVKGLGQLMYVLYAIGIVVLLVLILIVFKAENSLRRSADSMEKN
jgi:hypothetical protein